MPAFAHGRQAASFLRSLREEKGFMLEFFAEDYNRADFIWRTTRRELP